MNRNVIYNSAEIFFMMFLSCSMINGHYQSQFGQDRFLNELFFKNKKGGTFVDIGAHDGVSYSNTYFFEKVLGWKGICIEPLPKIYKKLEANRSCICVNGAITDKDGTVAFKELECPEGADRKHPKFNVSMLSGIESKYVRKHKAKVRRNLERYNGSSRDIEVNSYLLNSLLEKNNIRYIDYLSLDTEGGELEILKSIDFDRLYIYVIDVENNYKRSAMRKFLESKGFRFVINISVDEIYVNTKPFKQQRY